MPNAGNAASGSADTLLRHLSVADFGDDVASRYCTKLFAAMGARVVRFREVDDARIGYGGHCGEAYGRWLDLGKDDASRARSASDIAFDAVIGGQTKAALEAAERFARIASGSPLLTAISWFDAKGPYAHWRGSDEIILALNGVAYPFGERNGPPMLAQGHACQITAGVVAFNAALAALLHPESERPDRVDVNVLEAAMCFSETGALTGRLPGGASVRLGINQYVPTYPASPYKTSDGWVGLTCLTPVQWTSLCRIVGRDDLASDPRFATAYERLMACEEVDEALNPAFLAHSTAEWVALGLAHRIPITAMPRPGELPGVEHWRDRRAFRRLGHADAEAPTLPFRMKFDGVRIESVADTRREGAPPLHGVRVIDFSMGWAGPLCARTLGDLGADVIKVESDSHPDWWRGWEAGSVDAEARETKHNFLDVNRNKRGVDIDLTTPKGIEQAKALIATADVVVENYAAGVLSKLGLGPEVQRGLKPGIVSLSMPAFGNDGPLSGTRAYGSTVEQASGLPFVNGESNWVPSQQHIAFGDPVAGLFGAASVLAALVGRSRSGGADIDLAQVACLFQLGADAIIAEQVLGAHVPRTGHSRARLPFCAVVRGRGDDHWLAVAAQDETALVAMAEITGGPDVHALGSWSAARSTEDAASILQQKGVSAAPVLPAHVLSTNAQLAGAGFWVEMDRAHVGRHLVAAVPFRFDGIRPPLRIPAPVLGEHTDEIFKD